MKCKILFSEEKKTNKKKNKKQKKTTKKNKNKKKNNNKKHNNINNKKTKQKKTNKQKNNNKKTKQEKSAFITMLYPQACVPKGYGTHNMFQASDVFKYDFHPWIPHASVWKTGRHHNPQNISVHTHKACFNLIETITLILVMTVDESCRPQVLQRNSMV